MSTSCNIALRNATEYFWWEMFNDSGNGLVPSDNKLLLEPVLTKISVAKCLGHNELN